MVSAGNTKPPPCEGVLLFLLKAKRVSAVAAEKFGVAISYLDELHKVSS